MKEDAIKIREDFKKAEKNFRITEENLRRFENECRHEYGPTIYDPIHHEAYTIPGDPPGTMGIDWRGPFYVPAKTEKRWRRECKTCGRIEYTTLIEEKLTEVPIWPNHRDERRAQ